ncbi:agmatinase [bacterium]|nr:agmatinase [bacterium]
MVEYFRDQFFGLPPVALEAAQVVFLPLPFDLTVTYGRGSAGAPERILETSYQLETFDEETHVDFAEAPRIFVAPAVHPRDGEPPTGYLARVSDAVRDLPPARFLLSVGGEHLVTYGIVRGLYSENELRDLTIVQIDAHCDLIDQLEGEQWSHGTVMRRLLAHGCRFIQIGVRSLSKEEYLLAQGNPNIDIYYAHELHQRRQALLSRLADLTGDVYVSFDVDGLDPSVIWSTGTPQPDGLSWQEAMAVLRALFSNRRCCIRAADLVEFIPDPNPPGCDTTACKIISRMLAYWWTGQSR